MRDFIYNNYENCQIFVDLTDANETDIDYYSSLSNIKDIGIKSIQMFTKTINDVKTLELINAICSIDVEQIILNTEGISHNLRDNLSKDLDCITINCHDSIDNNTLIVISDLNKLYKNIGIKICLSGIEYLHKDILKPIEHCSISHIIFEPQWLNGEGFNLPDYMEYFNAFKDISNDYNNIYLPFGVYNRDFLQEHPCNIYLCSGEKCHSGKSNKTRRIYITRTGSVLPESLDFNTKFEFGNIKERGLNKILFDIDINGKNEMFTDLCKQVHRDVLVTATSPIIPWANLLTRYSHIVGEETNA